MMLIDTCHMLLNIPWQYDKSVLHDGQCNMYTFNIKRKYIILASTKKMVITETNLNKGKTCYLCLNSWMR